MTHVYACGGPLEGNLDEAMAGNQRSFVHNHIGCMQHRATKKKVNHDSSVQDRLHPIRILPNDNIYYLPTNVPELGNPYLIPVTTLRFTKTIQDSRNYCNVQIKSIETLQSSDAHILVGVDRIRTL